MHPCQDAISVSHIAPRYLSLPTLSQFLTTYTGSHAQYLRKSDSIAGDHFTFVLTELGGVRAFGFCRRHLPAPAVARGEADYPECVCLLTHHPFFSLCAQVCSSRFFRSRYFCRRYFCSRFLQKIFVCPRYLYICNSRLWTLEIIISFFSTNGTVTLPILCVVCIFLTLVSAGGVLIWISFMNSHSPFTKSYFGGRVLIRISRVCIPNHLSQNLVSAVVCRFGSLVCVLNHLS